MIGVYFSGTGNSKYCLTCFLEVLHTQVKTYAIEHKEVVSQIQKADEIIFAYPVQYSNVPKIVADFVHQHASIWKGKRIFIIATMGLFSGDGTGILARMLKKHGASIVGGIHVRMPDSICDEAALKKSREENKVIVRKAKEKMIASATLYTKGRPSQVGLGIGAHLLGLFGQRLYFHNKTKTYSDRLRIDQTHCTGCGTCVSLCPMKNLRVVNQKAVSGSLCTMCYRCVNGCPKQAITLLGKKVKQQGMLDKYL